MTEPIEATPQMWEFVEEWLAATTGVERAAWENIASILTHVGRFARQLHVLQMVALAEVAFGEHPEQVHAQWEADVAAIEAFLARFPL